MYTVITKKRVFRVRARSYTHLVNALVEAGIEWQGIHEDEEV